MINIGNRVMNTYLYQIEDGYVMIDTGYQNSFASCKKKLSNSNISIEDVKYILHTESLLKQEGWRKILEGLKV